MKFLKFDLAQKDKSIGIYIIDSDLTKKLISHFY